MYNPATHPEYETETAAHIEVFYVNAQDGWAAAEYTSDNNQMSGANYNYRKTWALKEARAMSGGIVPIKVYGQNGVLQKTYNDP
jgi:hypothetical protein